MSKRKALITAASKGIGFAVADKLMSEGCDIIISSSNAENLSHAAERLNTKHGSAVGMEICDLRDESAAPLMIERVLHHYGRIDILVNNCGGPKPGFFPEFTAQDWKSACNEILLSAVALIQGALPEMRKNKWGRIVNITSIAVFEYIENLLLSSTFRTALTSFSRVFARQNAQFNITINNVAPGYTLTERIYELSEIKAKKLGISREAVLTEMEASIPMKRMADPSEIAAATAFFCSVDADYITGNTLVVDGGFIHNIH